MSEGRVEHATVAVGAYPGKREISICPVYARGARSRIERHQNPDSISRKVPMLIDFFLHYERRRQMPDSRMFRILDVDPNVMHPGMTVEPAANKFLYSGQE